MSDFEVTSEAVKGTLEVIFPDADGTPLEGAKVVSEIQPAGQLKATGITGANGKVTFSDIKIGTYKFYVSRFDYNNAEFTADVTYASNEVITVILEQEQTV